MSPGCNEGEQRPANNKENVLLNALFWILWQPENFSGILWEPPASIATMMTDLLKLLPVLLRQAGDSDEAREQAVFAAWAAAVGVQIRRVTAPLRLERKTLMVAVPDATWRTQLQKFSGQALFKLNSLLGSPAVTGIEFVINPDVIARNTVVAPQVKFVAPDQQAMPLRESADRISNPEIRATFLRAAGKCLERRAR